MASELKQKIRSEAWSVLIGVIVIIAIIVVWRHATNTVPHATSDIRWQPPEASALPFVEPTVVFDRAFLIDQGQLWQIELSPATYTLKIRATDPVNLRVYLTKDDFLHRHDRNVTVYRFCNADQILSFEEQCPITDGGILAVEPYSTAYGANVGITITS